MTLLALPWGCKFHESDIPPDARPELSVKVYADGPGAPVPTSANPQKEIYYRCEDDRVPVLMYHDIIAKRDKSSVWFDLTVEDFKKQIDFIKENKLHPITLDALYDHLTKATKLPENPIVLTFDDNYQGFYDNAYPLLKAENWPCAMFVHTKYVGDQTGHPKMTWDTLKLLVAEKLVTIGSHTVTHPADISLLPSDQQEQELKDSKKELEEKLAIKVDYLAYPDGKNNAITQVKADETGYKMAFSTDTGMAEESPTIFSVNRYIANKLKECWEARQEAVTGAPTAIFESPITPGPVSYEVKDVEGVKLAMIKGGLPVSKMTIEGRQSVLEFVQQNQAAAGINGTFFAMAAVQGTSNEMIGPILSEGAPSMVVDNYPERLRIIRNRPMMLWDKSRMVILPFGDRLNNPDGLKAILPEVSNAFVAGAWLVHGGEPRNEEQLLAFGPSDLMDPRRRVFIGMTAEGSMIIGASLGSVSSEKLAKMASEAGVKEAVLLDSGFSTSLVYGDKIIASGHSTPTEPSRQVPHAILLMGTLAQDPNKIEVPQPTKSGSGRRRHKSK